MRLKIIIIRFKLIGLGGATFKLLAVVTYQNVVQKHTMGEISYFASVVKNKNKIIFHSFPLMWTYLDTQNVTHPFIPVTCTHIITETQIFVVFFLNSQFSFNT